MKEQATFMLKVFFAESECIFHLFWGLCFCRFTAGFWARLIRLRTRWFCTPLYSLTVKAILVYKCTCVSQTHSKSSLLLIMRLHSSVVFFSKRKIVVDEVESFCAVFVSSLYFADDSFVG